MTNSQFAVLLVDDEPELLEILGEQIRPLGWKILKASDGVEALKIIDSDGFRLVFVLSDFQMPGMNGLQLRQAMLENWKSIPFIMLSAHISREEALKAVELKISAFLPKPASSSEILTCLEKESADRVSALKEEQELLQGFVSEASGNLELLEPLVLELESRPHDLDLVNRIFGLVHTLKGASGFFHPLTLHHFVHKFEDLLSHIKQGLVTASPEIISVILQAVSILSQLIDELTTGRHTLNLQDLLVILDKKSGHLPASEPRLADASEPGKNIDLKKDLRVSVSLLDEFMQISGEMTVIRNMIDKSVRTLEKSHPEDRNIQQLNGLLEETHRINSAIQSKILDLRKIPMKSITKSFPRIVREIAMKLGKEAELMTIGDEIRVDTAVADVLNTSLIHLLRNSLDHGLEDIDERQQAGKASKGKITIESYIRGDDIFILISDDGRGLSTEKIKDKLVRNGRSPQEIEKLTEQEVWMHIFDPGLSTASTVTEVSGRGVGMDMVRKSVQSLKGDIFISTEKGKGTTFTLKIPTPKSVLISNSLIVRCEKQRMCLMQDLIARVLEIPHSLRNDFIRPLQGAQMLSLYGELMPFCDLRDLLNLPSRKTSEDPMHVVILNTQNGGKFALQVDEVLDIEDTVVKQLPLMISNLHIYSGITFLGDGQVGLILSPDAIAQKIHVNSHELKEKQVDLPTSASQSEYIIFELQGTDSLFAVKQAETRRLERILSKQIQICGQQKVTPYRGRILHLMDLADQLGFGPTPANSEAFLGLILEHPHRSVGFLIKSIVDIALADSNIDQTVRDRKGIKGTFSAYGKTVTLIDIAELIAS